MKLKYLENLIRDLKQQGFLTWAEKLKKINKKTKIYLVGGAVRDALLGVKNINDYDFVVQGIKLEKLGKELKKLGKVDFAGKNFGVFKFTPLNKNIKIPFDIALPRTELAFGTGGYRDFKVRYNENLKIKEDLSRRDFTINAFAFDIFNYKLTDEFKGIKDLQAKTIRTVGNAYERFGEDYSRMLRAIRFACQLDFQIEDVTWKAILKLMLKINNKHNIKKTQKKLEIGYQKLEIRNSVSDIRYPISDIRIVPYEIIGGEFLKSFILNPVRAFDLYDKSGAFKELIPEILKMKNCPQPKNWHSEGSVWNHTRLCLKMLSSKAFSDRFKKQIIFSPKISNFQFPISKKITNYLISAELVMSVLFHDIGKPYTILTPKKDSADRIRFNNHDKIGAEMAKKIFNKLKFSAVPELEFNTERTVWLISKHHLFDTKKIKEMKNCTIEKYFFSKKYNGENLLKLGFIDIMSSLHPNGEPDLTNFNLMVERINYLKRSGKNKKLPEPLLNGDEVMRILKLKPGIKVGKILKDLREKQLRKKIKTKEEAKKEISRLEKNKI